jgi:predicted ester cyclase
MSRENIATSERVLEEAFSQGNLEVLDEVCTDDYVDHDPLMGDTDRETVKQTIAAYREAFPDLEITVDEAFAAGDRVVIRWSGIGTFQNPFMGQQPTGQKGAAVHGIGIDRFEGDKIAESWGQWDTMQLMKNIGAVPEGAAAAAQ